MYFSSLLHHPQAWLLGVGLGLIVLALISWWIWSWLKPRGFRLFALTEFQSIQDRLATSDKLKFLQETNLLLRRVAIRSFGQAKVVGLTGKDWLEFLDWSRGTVNNSQEQGFIAGNGKFLNWEENINLPTDDEMQALIQLVIEWIKRHT